MTPNLSDLVTYSVAGVSVCGLFFLGLRVGSRGASGLLPGRSPDSVAPSF